MKSQFGKINSKVDLVLGGQDEIKSALKLYDLTKNIDPVKIHYLYEKVEKLRPKLVLELSEENKLSKQTKRKLEELINEFKEAELVPMAKSLIWSVTGGF